MSYYRIFSVLVSLFGLLYVTGISRAITIENNGYRDIVVAIADDVAERTSILDRLNDVFTDASAALYTATRNRAYLEKVTVLVPESWSDNSAYEATSGETFGNADVIIQNPDGQDVVHVIRPRQDCGTVDPDAKMYISTDRLNKGDRDSWARLLVHEWAHLRYGVYDEYPADGEAQFYAAANGAIEAVRCTTAITGRQENRETGGRCRFVNNLPEPNCIFVEDPNQDRTGFASVMYRPSAEKINMFCEDDGDADVLHNAEAPNKHNRACGMRSVWSVLMQHEDFLGVNEARIVGSTVPQITFKKQQAGRTVLVLDVSGSMASENRILRLGQACRTYITDTAKDGDQLGIVWFSSVASIEKELTVVSDSTRAELLSKVPTTTGGGTSIGAGLQKAVDMLNAGNNCEGTIIIFTDGEQNTPPSIEDVQERVLACGITVSGVAISGSAEMTLDNIISLTNGEISYADDKSNVITDALSRVAQVNSPPSQRRYTLLSLVLPNVTVSSAGSIDIDATLGRNLLFVFDYTGDDITVGVRLPSGASYDVTSSIVTHDTVFKTYTFSIPDVDFEAGSWSYSVSNPSSQDTNVGITVTSQTASDQTATYMTEVYWAPSTVPSLSPELDKVMQIVATVSLGTTPVLNAEVQVSVDTPAGSVLNYKLRDDGAGGDLQSGDGIYTTLFLEYDDPGRYGLQVRCRGTDETVANINDVLGETADDLGNPTAPQDPVPTGNFERTQIGSSFSLNSYTAPTTQYPPSKITDLVVIAAFPSNNSVVLQWTAVGDQLMTGTADAYDLRRGTSFRDMQNSFDTQERLVNADVISGGDLNSPGQAYEQETFTVNVPDAGDITYVFAVKAIGTTGVVGEISNIATVSMADLDDDDDDGDGDDSLSMALIISIACIGSMFVIGVLIAILVKMQSTLRSKYEEKHSSREKLYSDITRPYSTMGRRPYPPSVPRSHPYWINPSY